MEPVNINTPRTDFAQKQYRNDWLHHPVLGDPSWDTFKREPENPIHIGTPPYEWPVNGFLFHDPPSSTWYAYIGLYPQNYWPAGGCLLYKEQSPHQWKSLGVILCGDQKTFDGNGTNPGGSPDISLVYQPQMKKYHMVYDWGTYMNDRGGLGYAWADSPEGPFYRSPIPLFDDATQELIFNRYKRAYAATLIMRAKDWLILCMMSTPRNAGGTWAMVGMKANAAEGPYSPPFFLLYPQSQIFHPPLLEFFPAFTHEGFIYAPATSVARNRSFQTVFKAPIESAHLAEAWEINQLGSVWHDLVGINHEQGIWGQTFSAQIFSKNSNSLFLRALSFSKTKGNKGTVHLSDRPWLTAYQDGFHLGAPYGSTHAILLHEYTDFDLEMVYRANGNWAVCWDCRNPLGPSHFSADAVPHPRMNLSRVECWFKEDIALLLSINYKGVIKHLSEKQGIPKISEEESLMKIKKQGEKVQIFQNDRPIFDETSISTSGRIELRLDPDASIKLSHFHIAGKYIKATQNWLSTEGLIGAASDRHDWKLTQHPLFLYEFGYLSTKPNSMAKWNVIGENFRLFGPKHPKLGQGDLILDGKHIVTIDFHATKKQKSNVVAEFTVTHGSHAIILKPIQGIIPCDTLQSR